MNKIKLRNSDFSDLKHRLELCGWKIVFFNTPEGDHLAQRLGVVDSTLKTDSFVCKIDTLQYIFINADLSEKDKKIVLLHEAGHINLNHDFSHTTKLDELEAWHFAYKVVHKTTLKKWCAAIIAFAIAFVLCAFPFTQSQYTERVFVTEDGEKYHRNTCISVQGKNCIELTVEEAKKQYLPCLICNP